MVTDGSTEAKVKDLFVMWNLKARSAARIRFGSRGVESKPITKYPTCLEVRIGQSA